MRDRKEQKTMFSPFLSDLIIGKWTTGSVTVEFLKDGTMKSTSQGKTEVLGYKFLESHMIEIGVSGHPTTWQSYNIDISGKSLTLTQTKIGSPIVYTKD